MDIVPLIRFVFALFLGGLAIFIGIPIIDIFTGIFPASGPYYAVMHGLWSIFPVLIILREAIGFFRTSYGERA